MNISEQGLKLLRDYYMREYEDTPEEAFKRTSNAFSFNDEKSLSKILIIFLPIFGGNFFLQFIFRKC